MESEPAGGYMLCTSPRSGSTLLCDMLSRTGTAGRPASYLRPASISAYAIEWQLPALKQTWDASYLKAVRHHSAGGSGCPALRIMWSDMPVVLDRIRAIDPEGTSDKARIQHLLGIEHFVYLQRRDLVAQAISLVLAHQTGLWHKNADGSIRQMRPGGSPPVYDEQGIAAELHLLEAEVDGWETWFKSQSITPVRLAYEELAADPTTTLKELLKAIGRRIHPPLPEPGTRRLATSINDEWARRFRRQRGS